MRRGDIREITVDGQTFSVEYLGKGHFCRGAWMRSTDRRVFLFVDEEDYSKEILGDGPCSVNRGPHLPYVTKHEDHKSRGGGWQSVYSMDYYEPLKPRHKEAWSVFRLLKDSRERLLRSPVYTYGGARWPLEHWGSYLNVDIIEDTRGKVPETVTTALQELADAAGNYGQGMTFEFAARNLGVDAEDMIVFRDCLFDAEKIAQYWRSKRRA